MANIGNFPSDPGFTSANFKQNTLVKRTRTQSGRIVRTSNATTLWAGTLQFPTMSQAEFRPIQAFIALTQGSLNDFDIVIPFVSESQSPNKDSVTCLVDGDYAVGSTAIDVATAVSSANALKAGDVVRFANHTKVYMVTTDVNSDVAGNATLNIQPGLVEALTNGESVTTDDVPFRMTLTGDLQEFNYRTDGLVSYEINVEEVL